MERTGPPETAAPRGKRRKLSPRMRFFIIALVPVLWVGLLWAAAATRGRGEPGEAISVSGSMPPIRGPALTGGRVGPDLYRGKIVLVNFWASWCGPCRREQPGLQRLWAEYSDRGVQFIGVNFQDDPAAARAYVDEFGVTYPSVRDPDGMLAYRFGVPYIPTTVLTGSDGQMRYRLLGAQTETTLLRHLDGLLAKG
jgi:thiol-disulfide isomerase/thioredoxin